MQLRTKAVIHTTKSWRRKDIHHVYICLLLYIQLLWHHPGLTLFKHSNLTNIIPYFLMMIDLHGG